MGQNSNLCNISRISKFWARIAVAKYHLSHMGPIAIEVCDVVVCMYIHTYIRRVMDVVVILHDVVWRLWLMSVICATLIQLRPSLSFYISTIKSP